MIPRDEMRSMLIDLVQSNQVVFRQHTTQKLLDRAVAMSVQENLIEIGFALSMLNGLAVMGPKAMNRAIAALACAAADLDPAGYLERILEDN